ncbi:hypothetical protein HAX54_035329, partial [Datura stramonium]|nr:hypothetical protein [Datura stramonium]
GFGIWYPGVLEKVFLPGEKIMLNLEVLNSFDIEFNSQISSKIVRSHDEINDDRSTKLVIFSGVVRALSIPSWNAFSCSS